MSLDLSHPVGTCRPCWPRRRHNVMTFLRTELFFFFPQSSDIFSLCSPQIIYALSCLTFNLATLGPGRFADCTLSVYPWPWMGSSWQACRRCHRLPSFSWREPEEAVGEGRDESAGGLRCDSGAADSGSAFTALPLNVKVITGPWLLWLLWKDAEPAVWVMDGTTACVQLQQ